MEIIILAVLIWVGINVLQIARSLRTIARSFEALASAAERAAVARKMGF